jgi:TonB family protein
VSFGGETLVGGTSSFAVQVGNGQALNGPVGKIGPTPAKDKPSAGNVADAPRVVPEGSLSRRAVPPPDMSDLLLQNYPPGARAQGVAGSARLSMRIYADGRVGDIKVLRETGNYGFGEACTKILKLRRWQPPLDKEGRPVATDARYECDFEVAY